MKRSMKQASCGVLGILVASLLGLATADTAQAGVSVAEHPAPAYVAPHVPTFEPAPIVSHAPPVTQVAIGRRVVVYRRPVVVARPRVVVAPAPVYVAPRVVVGPRVYYRTPVRRAIRW